MEVQAGRGQPRAVGFGAGARAVTLRTECPSFHVAAHRFPGRLEFLLWQDPSPRRRRKKCHFSHQGTLRVIRGRQVYGTPRGVRRHPRFSQEERKKKKRKKQYSTSGCKFYPLRSERHVDVAQKKEILGHSWPPADLILHPAVFLFHKGPFPSANRWLSLIQSPLPLNLCVATCHSPSGLAGSRAPSGRAGS